MYKFGAFTEIFCANLEPLINKENARYNKIFRYMAQNDIAY